MEDCLASGSCRILSDGFLVGDECCPNGKKPNLSASTTAPKTRWRRGLFLSAAPIVRKPSTKKILQATVTNHLV
jgi:hypothetical protein